MATLNKSMLIGRLTADPEAPRVLPNTGSTVVKFRLAVGRGKKRQDGTWDDSDTMYIDCEVFSRPDAKFNLAEFISKYAAKGSEVYCEGRLKLDEWDDKGGGGKRSKHKIVVDTIELLGGKSEPKEPIDAEDPGRTFAPKQQQQRPAPQPAKSNEDIPF